MDFNSDINKNHKLIINNDKRLCEMCKEEIQWNAIKCKHCGSIQQNVLKTEDKWAKDMLKLKEQKEKKEQNETRLAIIGVSLMVLFGGVCLLNEGLLIGILLFLGGICGIIFALFMNA